MFEVIWCALILTAAALSGSFYKHLLDLSHKDGQLPAFTEAIYASGIVVLSYLALKVYCITWRSLSPRSTTVGVYEGIAVPAISLCMPALISFGGMSPDWTTLGSGIAFPLLTFSISYLLLCDTFGILRKGVGHFIVEPYGSGIEHFSTRNPPISRTDIWPMDILLNGFWITLTAYRFVEHL